jgi:hypothetical protein
MALLNQRRADGAPAEPSPPAASRRPLARLGELARLRALARGLASWLFLGALLSCSSPPRTQNPGTLWVSFGQTELDLVLADAEPPYY